MGFRANDDYWKVPFFLLRMVLGFGWVYGVWWWCEMACLCLVQCSFFLYGFGTLLHETVVSTRIDTRVSLSNPRRTNHQARNRRQDGIFNYTWAVQDKVLKRPRFTNSEAAVPPWVDIVGWIYSFLLGLMIGVCLCIYWCFWRLLEDAAVCMLVCIHLWGKYIKCICNDGIRTMSNVSNGGGWILPTLENTENKQARVAMMNSTMIS